VEDELTETADEDPGRGGTLTVLGCDGSYPGPAGAASGYLVEAAGAALWLDAGSGTFAALQRVADPGRLDAVVLSHEHPDHWSDLDAYAVWLHEHAPGRPVHVYAPPGLRRHAYFADDPVLSWHELEAGTDLEIAGLRCTFSATDHGPPTLAVRVGAGTGHALGYSADTGPGWSPEALGPGLDVLLCEATYTKAREGEARHLSGRQAGAMAAGAGVGGLVLTHRRPSTSPDALAAEAEAAFGGPVEHAAPGRVFAW
jgi:ribonuclease BN (tRNA processing enzyme)